MRTDVFIRRFPRFRCSWESTGLILRFSISERIRSEAALPAADVRRWADVFFDDDVCNELREKMIEADGIVIGSPVYYAGPNGALCAVLDRVFYTSQGRLARKPAAAVASCRRGGASATFDRLNKYFTISKMPVVASQYWNSIHGTCAEEARQDAEGLQTMRTLADHMAWMLKAVAADSLTEPADEAQIKTNFIR